MKGQITAVSMYREGYVGLRLALIDTTVMQPGHYLAVNGRAWGVIAAEDYYADCLRRHFPPPVVGDEVDCSGPAGDPFDLTQTTARALLLGDATGLASLLFLARRLRHHQPRVKPLLLLNADEPLPCLLQPSHMIVPGIPGDVIAALPWCEDVGIPSRVSAEDRPGCFAGTLTALARAWFEVCQGIADVTLYGCGRDPLLAEIDTLASGYQLGCQLRSTTLAL